METVKLWESKQKDKYIFFNNIEDYFNYLKSNGRDLNFRTKEYFTPGDEIEDNLDNSASKSNIRVIYTDNEHPIAAYLKSYGNTYILPSFYETHKEEFIAFAKKALKEAIAEEKFVSIPNFIFSEEIIDEIIANDYTDLSFYIIECTNNLELSEELKQKIKDHRLELTASYRYQNNEKISTKYIIDYHTMKDLKTIKQLRLYIPISDETINNLIYVNPDATIILDYNKSEKKDELTFFKSVTTILNDLAKHNKEYNIKISVENRELLRQSQILNSMPSNVNLTIDNDLNDYDLETYLKEEEKLEKIISPIRNANLSPFEKYLAVYDIVKKFKPYKENDEDREKARDLRYILDDNNDYIVCVGFSKLLNELLNRVGIANKNLSVVVDTSYDEGYTMEEKTLTNVGHARNMIKIDDDKYNIHGIYIADSTWDNDIESDYYLNALMTFDRKKEAYRLEKLRDEDLLFDFHNFDEFKEKINYLLKTEIKNNIFNKKEDINKRLITAYTAIFKKIMNTLKTIDYNKYKYFYDKYNELIKNNNTNLKEFEEIVSNFLTEYGHYILPLSNNKVDLETIIEASANAKKALNNLSDEEAKIWLENTKRINQEKETKAFPYKYDPSNNTEAYLEDSEEFAEKGTKTK